MPSGQACLCSRFRGRTFASRVGASLLAAAGLADLITTSLEDYEALALRLAQSPGDLSAVRGRLLSARVNAPLFNVNRFRQAIESAYEEMVRRWRDGQAPCGDGLGR